MPAMDQTVVLATLFRRLGNLQDHPTKVQWVGLGYPVIIVTDRVFVIRGGKTLLILRPKRPAYW